MGFGRQSRLVSFFRSALAAGGAVLIFVLGLFAASPILHQHLHHDTGLAADDGCAIVLFANGVSLPLTVIAAPPTAVEWGEQPYHSSIEIILDSPRYLLHPERGPPVG